MLALEHDKILSSKYDFKALFLEKRKFKIIEIYIGAFKNKLNHRIHIFNSHLSKLQKLCNIIMIHEGP